MVMFVTDKNELVMGHANRRCLSDHDYCRPNVGSANIDSQRSEADQQQTIDRSQSPRLEDKDEQIALTNLQIRQMDDTNTNKRLKLVAVHLGAGNCNNDGERLQFARMVCEKVMLQTESANLKSNYKRKKKNSSGLEDIDSSLNNITSSAESAVVQLIKQMEDYQLLNCGYGSNLNINGQVECDASLMSDRTQVWCGVGAVSGCKNPIMLAKSLYDNRNNPKPLGLIQPNLLVGSGAKQWMREYCPSLSIMDSKLISSKAFSTYVKLKSRHDAAVKLSSQKSHLDETLDQLPSYQTRQSECQSIAGDPNAPTNLDHGSYCAAINEPSGGSRSTWRRKFDPNIPILLKNRPQQTKSNSELRLDTVGAVVVDSENNFASAISSGGLLLKYKGRVGQAAVPGAGCWSEDSVAATTTGVGEYLTLNMFAKKFYDKIQMLRLLYDLGHVDPKSDPSNLISCGMEECFEDLMRSNALSGIPLHERLAGMLAVCTFNSKDSSKREAGNELYLSYAHNTNSMCVGYMTNNDLVAQSINSRNLDEKDGRPSITTIKFTLNSGQIEEKVPAHLLLNQIN